jgi:predicted nucleic acid-binding protein
VAKRSVYLETTIIGWLTNRPNTDVILEGHRQLTLRWWNQHRQEYELSISQVVVDEISKGDAMASADRQNQVRGIPLLPLSDAIAKTATDLVRIHALPPKALNDALHVAVCAHHRIDFLLTWNCTHIANPHILRLVRRHFERINLWMPEVTTPESLLGGNIHD